MKKLFSFLLVLVLSFSVLFAFGCEKPNKGPKAPGHKVILFIGDGMGENHIANTELYYDIKLSFTSFETKTMVDTSSRTTLNNGYTPTDSAAAATAMATGTRVLNDVVAVDAWGEPLPSITELAKNDGYGTGVVTSDLITGATPAGFSAHSKKRTNDAAIVMSQIDGTIDLLLGSGSYSGYIERMNEKGVTLVTKYSELSYDMPKNAPRIFATFTDVEPSNNTDDTPNLVQLTTFAINFMEKNFPNAYFLMIEGAKIDKKSHSNLILDMMENVIDFSNAIEKAKTLVTGDYTFIVTADHETGALELAESVEQIDNSIDSENKSSLYHSTNHSTANVPLYYYSTKGDVHSMLNNDVILNTNVFDLCCYLLEIEVA